MIHARFGHCLSMSATSRVRTSACLLACLSVVSGCGSDASPGSGLPGAGGSPGGAGAAGASMAGASALSGAGGAVSGAGGAPGAAGAVSGAGASTGGASGSVGAGGAAPTGGGYTKTISIDTSATGANVKADVEKFPLAVQLDATNFDFSQAAPGGVDVRFEKLDGTALPHSIEHWDAMGKTAALWVKVDKVSANLAGQKIRMVWGSPGAAAVADSKAVFSTADGFYGVWHLDEDGTTTAGGYKDSSAHEAHGTGINMIPGSRVNARIGKGINLDNKMGQNTARWVRVDGDKTSAFNPSATTAITASVWVLAHSYPIYSYETILSKGDTSWSLQRVQYESTGYQSCLLAGGQPGYHFCIYDFVKQPLVTEQWLHFMLVLQQPKMTLYINGELNAEGTGSGWNQGSHPLGIGNQTQFTSRRQWDGTLDEARVMQGARSASWAKLDFETQRPMQKAVTYGATEPRP